LGAMDGMPPPHSSSTGGRRPRVRAGRLALAAVSIAAVSIAAMLAPGCGDPGAMYAEMDGEALYRLRCMQCHGPEGKGLAANPSYRGVRDDWSAETLLEYIDDPAAFKRTDAAPRRLRGSAKYMPPVDRHMPADARERLVEHALGLMDALKVR